jgi:hypothetical protein
MATQSQRFRARKQRAAKPAKKKQPQRPRRDRPVDTSKPGVSATDRRAGLTGSANRAARAREGAALEETESARPSRKSTRKSHGRVKRTSNLHRRAIRKNRSPKTRARKAKAKAK